MSNTVLKALESLKQGRPIIIADSKERENEGDLVASARMVTDGTVNFMVQHSSGVLCLVMTEDRMKELKLTKLRTEDHQRDKFMTNFGETFEAAEGITTGISAKDRAYSVRLAADPSTTYKDIISPGHVFTLAAHKNLLKGRRGHTEASATACELAGLGQSAVIVEVASPSGGIMTGNELTNFANTYNIDIVTIDELEEFYDNPSRVIKYSESNLPTQFGEFKISVWKNTSGEEIIAVAKGDLQGEGVPVRFHSQCLTGEVFHSLKCDCEEQLDRFLQFMQENNQGLLLYLNQEGRGIGIADKIKAYSLQDQGRNTIEANLEIGKPIDARNWDFALEVLKQYPLKSIKLVTNNPDKVKAVSEIINQVEVIHLPSTVNKYNQGYLETKIKQLNHNIRINKEKN
ncbi:GTP cyclohydrolase II RibA [Apibacter muscae]|uniref:3,4-dihydroxy-2-butanone 4-phosphate synthase n=1 Tax=Apibacter muscae TaxID=2509004 RepID=A0A563D7M8_9FLAO|nr:GTP cyclohydrolase II RibA [Apibacter muscae]TWP26236.1 GTP cyclohydrolase II RibA [Apibacter muscae]